MLEIIMGIFSFEKTITRNDLLEQVEMTENAIENEIIPMITETAEGYAKLASNSKRERALLENFKAIGIDRKSSEDAFSALEDYFKTIHYDMNTLRKKITNDLPKVMTNRSFSPYNAYLTHLGNSITDMSLFVSDFLFFTINEMSDESRMPKKTSKGVEESMISFKAIYRSFKDGISDSLEIAQNDFSSTPLDQLDQSTWAGLVSSRKTLLPINNFIGNPIYHFRKWLVERDVDKIEALADKRAIVKAQLQELRLSENDEVNPHIADALDYYENRLNKLNKELENLKG